LLNIASLRVTSQRYRGAVQDKPTGRNIADLIADLAREVEEDEAEADQDAPLPPQVKITRGNASVRFSDEDPERVAATSDFPSLSWLAATQSEALSGLEVLGRANRTAKAAKERAAMLPPSLKFHALRHTYASLCITAGRPIFELARFMGHASPRTTETIYAPAQH